MQVKKTIKPKHEEKKKKKKEWQQHISFSILYQATQGSSTKYLIISYHSCPVLQQSLSLCPLPTHTYSTDTSAFGNSNSAIYGFFLQKVPFLCSFTDCRSIDSRVRQIPKPLQNKSESHNCFHTWPSLGMSKIVHTRKHIFILQHRLEE